jgi:hypothetical protein
MGSRYILSGITAGLILFLMGGPLVATASGQDGRTGYVNRTGVDWLTGNSGNSLRLQMTHAYQFTERFAAGIGSGYVFYRDPLNLVPVFVDLVYLLRDDGTTPFFQLRTGYSFSVLHERDLDPERHKVGPTLNPVFGLQVRNKNGTGFYLSTGFNLDTSQIEQEGFGGQVTKENISYRRLSLSFGFIF